MHPPSVADASLDETESQVQQLFEFLFAALPNLSPLSVYSRIRIAQYPALALQNESRQNGLIERATRQLT